MSRVRHSGYAIKSRPTKDRVAPRANTLRETGLPIIIVTTLGVKSGKIRKIPLMRVEHDGEYALVASKGGAPAHPVWYYNLKDNKGPIEIQDGPAPEEFDVREVGGEERAHVVGASGGRVPALRGVPGEDRSTDPSFRRIAPPLTLRPRTGRSGALQRRVRTREWSVSKRPPASRRSCRR